MRDAHDVIKAMLAMPFVLDGLADKELQLDSNCVNHISGPVTGNVAGP
jgi:hypothetical protein